MTTPTMTNGLNPVAAGAGLTARHVALLRAVAAGRAEVTCSAVPDLYVDGRCCTDHAAGLVLDRAGLIGAGDGRLGQRVPARLTPAGASLLAALGSTAGGAR